MTTSLKKLALRGTAWIAFSYGASQSLRFISNLILTRLLVPEYFGLMALVNTFRQGLELFSDIGLAQNVVRSERGDDPVFLNTAWTISILRSVLLWVVLLFLAWPISHFYNEPLLLPVLLAISINVLIDGARSTTLFSLSRHLQLGKVSLFYFSVQLLSTVVMIVAAWIYPSVWALVIGSIAGSIFKTLGSFFLFPGHKHKILVEPESKNEIISFGRWIFLSSIVMFLAEQSDRLILGKLVPLEVLSVYSIAYVLASMPQKLMKQMSAQIIFPLVSKQANIPRPELRRKINRQRWKLHGILIIVFVFMAGFGDILIRMLYDNRYEQAAWMMPVLALGTWFSALFFIADPCILGLGKSFYTAQSRALRLLVVTFGLLIGFKLAGILGALLVIACGDLPAYFTIQYALHKEGIGCFWEDLLSTSVLVLIIGLVFLLRIRLGLGLPFDSYAPY